MIFAGPRGPVKCQWRQVGYSYAEVVVYEQNTGWSALWMPWREVWCGPKKRAAYLYKDMECALPDELISRYKETLDEWFRYDAAWRAFHDSQAVQVPAERWKLLPKL